MEHKQIEGSIDIFLGNYLGFLAKLLAEMGLPAEAVPYAEQAVVVFAEYFGPDHVETGMIKGMWLSLVTQAEGV